MFHFDWGIDDENLLAKTDEALAIACHHGDETEIAFCLWRKGRNLNPGTQCAEAVPYYEQSIEISRAVGDAFTVALALRPLAFCIRWQNFERFMVLCKEGLALCQEIGDLRFASFFWVYLGAEYFYHGRYVDALCCHQAADEGWRKMGNRGLVALSTASCAWIWALNGDFDKALTLTKEALALAAQYDFKEAEWFSLTILCFLNSMQERYQAAWAISLKNIKIESGNATYIYESNITAAIAACGLENHDAAHRHMIMALKQFEPRSHGMMTWCLPVAACIEAHTGSQERAVELLGLVFTHPASATGWMEKWPLLNRLRAELEASLGPKAYAAAWERGQALDLEAVVAQLLEEGAATEPETLLDSALSDRQMEVLRCLADGMTDRQIAEHLGISTNTVSNHIRRIYAKLDVHSRSEALQRAKKMKLP
jgi:DNA-binding CsgD family transcriptional regulator